MINEAPRLPRHFGPPHSASLVQLPRTSFFCLRPENLQCQFKDQDSKCDLSIAWIQNLVRKFSKQSSKCSDTFSFLTWTQVSYLFVRAEVFGANTQSPGSGAVLVLSGVGSGLTEAMAVFDNLQLKTLNNYKYQYLLMEINGICICRFKITTFNNSISYIKVRNIH